MVKELTTDYLNASKAPRIVQKDLRVPLENGDSETITVYFKKLSARQSGDFQVALIHADTNNKRAQHLALAKVKYLALCLCDKDGNLLYEGTKGIQDLSEIPCDLLEILHEASTDVNPIGEKKEQLKRQEEEEKNS